MAETQKATTGKKSQVWLETGPGTGIYKQLVQVTEFALPQPEQEQLDATHLESDGKEYIPGDVDYGELEVSGNYRPGSDTDERLEELAVGDDTVNAIFIVAERGTLTKQYSCDVNVSRYGPDTIDRAVNKFTATLRATGAVTSTAYTTPPATS